MSPKYSAEHLSQAVAELRRTVERQRRTLLWVVEHLDLRPELRQGVPPPHLPCATCGHDITAHADSCLFPLIEGAPFALCPCVAFQPLTDD